jgi:hypothetical protein
MDFGPAAERWGAEGFGRATVFTLERELAGNLRLRFPDARIVCAGHPSYTPPGVDGPRFFVWNTDLFDLNSADLDLVLGQRFGLHCEPGATVGRVEVPGRRVNRLGYVRLAPGPDDLP